MSERRGPKGGTKGVNARGKDGLKRRGSGREATIRVKTARGRKLSSTMWLQRQLNDPYVQEAHRLGYRSRAAFKLIELDDQFHFLAPGARIIDLGAAPGGWTQVAIERIKPERTGGIIVALDIIAMEPLAGAEVLECDFLDDDAPDRLKAALGGEADAVISDMAAPATGHPPTDHLRIIGLVETALEFAEEVLKPGGTFVAKVFQGGTEGELLKQMKQHFKTVRHAKPPASRKGSPEMYVVALGYKGKAKG